jgi:hypothetical protein
LKNANNLNPSEYINYNVSLIFMAFKPLSHYNLFNMPLIEDTQEKTLYECLNEVNDKEKEEERGKRRKKMLLKHIYPYRLKKKIMNIIY